VQATRRGAVQKLRAAPRKSCVSSCVSSCTPSPRSCLCTSLRTLYAKRYVAYARLLPALLTNELSTAYAKPYVAYAAHKRAMKLQAGTIGTPLGTATRKRNKIVSASWGPLAPKPALAVFWPVSPHISFLGAQISNSNVAASRPRFGCKLLGSSKSNPSTDTTPGGGPGRLIMYYDLSPLCPWVSASAAMGAICCKSQ
jgi:hypothetical protein